LMENPCSGPRLLAVPRMLNELVLALVLGAAPRGVIRSANFAVYVVNAKFNTDKRLVRTVFVAMRMTVARREISNAAG